MLSALTMYNFSPLRIIPPVVQSHSNGFVVYSGITNTSAAISNDILLKNVISKYKIIKYKLIPLDHFRKGSKVRVLLNEQNKFKLEATTPEKCAIICLNDSVLKTNYYRCLSFDFCPTNTKKFMCSFYNSTFETDPSLISDSQPECDHYSSMKYLFFNICSS